jgi:hypothetical protein
METLYEFKKINYTTIKYKNYNELGDYDINSFKNLSAEPFFFDIKKVKDHFEVDKTYYDEKTYNDNLKNILSHCRFDKITFVVCADENKTSLKFFTYFLQKNVGQKFFSKETFCDFITYNHKTHTLYTGAILNYHKKKKCVKNVRKNNWFEGRIKILSQKISNLLKYNNKNVNDFDSLYNQQKEVNKCFEIFFSNIPNINNEIKNPDQRIYERFLIGHGIKYPNNWASFNMIFPAIKLKDLRKNKMKFVDTFMSVNKLNGDKIKRVLHTVNSTNGVNALKFSLSLFGNDFILSKSDEIIKNIIETNLNADLTHMMNIFLNLGNFTKNEKKNCFEIFKLVLKGEINIMTFIDHIITKNRLEMVEPVQWKSLNYTMFTGEHYEWAEKLGTHKDVEYHRFYDTIFQNFIEQPINEYSPVLLTTTKEYNMESFVQHNCVRTYADKPESMIISLRKNDDNSRATIEYKIKGDYNDITLIRVQNLGKFNQTLDDSWHELLKILDTRIEYTLKNNVFKLPYVEVKQGSHSYLTDLKFVDISEYRMIPGQRGKTNTEKVLIFEKNILSKNHMF